MADIYKISEGILYKYDFEQECFIPLRPLKKFKTRKRKRRSVVVRKAKKEQK